MAKMPDWIEARASKHRKKERAKNLTKSEKAATALAGYTEVEGKRAAQILGVPASFLGESMMMISTGVPVSRQAFRAGCKRGVMVRLLPDREAQWITYFARYGRERLAEGTIVAEGIIPERNKGDMP